MKLLLPLLCSLLFFIQTSSVDEGGIALQDTCPSSPTPLPVFFNGLPCKNPATVVPSDFKTSKLNHAGDTDNFLRSSVSLANAVEFPGLNTLGLSMARTDMAMDGMVPPHSHPRASEMMYIARGSVIVGFLDTKNRLFQKSLGEGDVFVVPRGLLHFCLNAGYGLATVHSVLNSQNPGVASIAGAMFGEELDLQKWRLRLRGLGLGGNKSDVGFFENDVLG